jgi:predicted Zn-dependent peptidase
MNRTTAVLLTAGLLLATAPAFGVPELSLHLDEYALSNGLHVVLAPDDALDDVSVVLRYDVGSADDPAGKDGLAHIVEHLMFDGSKHVPAGEHARWLAHAGGTELNATTSLDRTEYYVTIPPEQLGLALWLESDRMGYLSERVDEATLARERDLVTYEASDRVFDRALGTLGAMALAEVFPAWHPYHRDPDPRWIPSITLADVRAFLRTWYGPANATLIVAGRFDPAEALGLAKRYFGGLRGAIPPVRPTLPGPWDTHDVLVQMHANVRQARVVFLWPTPAFGEAGDAELDVAAAMLAGPGGRLQTDLVDYGSATAVLARQHSNRRASVFVISAVLPPEQSPTEVADTVDRIGHDLARAFRPNECEKARTLLDESRLLALETSMGRARRLSAARRAASVASTASPWELGRYGRISCEDVRRTVATALVPNRRTVVLAFADPSAPWNGRVVSRSEWLR